MYTDVKWLAIYCPKIIKQHVKYIHTKDRIEQQITHQKMENQKEDIMDKTDNAYIINKAA